MRHHALLGVIVGIVLVWTTGTCRAGEHPGGAVSAPSSTPPSAKTPEHPGKSAPASVPIPAPAPSATPAPSSPAKTHEHPGAEHPGHDQEHPRKKAGDEPHSRRFTAPEIKAAMHQYVTSATTQGGGVFAVRDAVAKKDLRLTFVKLHDPVRAVAGRGYFACADFRGIDDGTLYDIDVWLSPHGEHLQPTETVVHKVAGRPRFTYRDDQAVPVP